MILKKLYIDMNNIQLYIYMIQTQLHIEMIHTHNYILAMHYSLDGKPQLIFTTCQIINIKNNRAYGYPPTS